jgi:hypothetical protein
MQTNARETRRTAGTGAGRLRSPLLIGLGALLAVQLVAALVLSLGGRDLSPAESEGPLLAFEPEEVMRLRIASGEQELVVERSEDGWQLPALGGFPVSEIKVTDLLGKLAGIQRRIPVGTTAAAIARFKVGEDGFERRLTLEVAAGPLGTLYLGDSPGFRRLFVRADGDAAVYEAQLALFDVADKADEWTKKTLLQLEPEAIEGIRVGAVALARGEDGAWTLEGLAEDEALDQEAVEDLVGKIANLSFRGVLGTAEKPEYGQDAPLLTLEVDLAEASRSYVVSALVGSEDRVLKVSSQPYYFRLSQLTAEDLTEITREGLIARADESVKTSADGMAPEAPEGGDLGMGSEVGPAPSSPVEMTPDAPAGPDVPRADPVPPGSSTVPEGKPAPGTVDDPAVGGVGGRSDDGHDHAR